MYSTTLQPCLNGDRINLDDGGLIYIYIYMCTLPLRFIKERNKVSTASAYYLEQWRARLIVDGISVKTDKTVKESRGRATEKKAEAERE